MPLSVFYVRADTADGDNQDLLVCASVIADVASIWRATYELDESNTPMWIGQLPGVSAEGEARALDWGLINPIK
jgi:hypothetical protein